MEANPSVTERIFQASVEKVWKAITDKNEMRQWYFDLEAFKPEAGFEFAFDAGEEGRQFRHICKITEVVAHRKLAYTWRYDGYQGNSLATFELFPEGEQTRLKLTHEGLETFPPLPDFAKENFAQGWTFIIGTQLRDYLEKEPHEYGWDAQ